MDRASTARRRDWAGLVAISAGVVSLGFAIWATPLATGEAAGGVVRNISLTWLSYAIAGVLAVAGVAVAQRRRRPGRILVAVGGVVLLLGLLGFAQPHGATWASIIPGLLMLGTAPFVGPIPRD